MDSSFPLIYPVFTINLISTLLLVALVIFIFKFRKRVGKGLRFLIILALLVAITGFALSIYSGHRVDFLRFELWPEGFFEGIWSWVLFGNIVW